MTMIKWVYDHSLTLIRGFCLKATFWYTNILTNLNYNFFVFHDNYMLYRLNFKLKKIKILKLKFLTQVLNLVNSLQKKFKFGIYISN